MAGLACFWPAQSLAGQEAAAPETRPSQERRPATLVGRVVSATTGGPLEGAMVVLMGSGAGAVTDSAGDFRLPPTWAGVDTAEVRFIGYTPSQTELTLEPNATTRVVFLLSQTVLRVADLKVEIRAPSRSTKLRGFEERRAKGFGAFITPDRVQARNATLTSDHLRGIPGVTVGREEFGRAPVVIGRNAQGCSPAVFLDGIYHATMWVDDIPKEDVGAIEVYRGPSELPAEFHRAGGRHCGAVVIWTPDGPEFFDYTPPERRP
jgi:hypothetical protein